MLDGGAIGSARHTYTAYGMVMSSDIVPVFGDESHTCKVAPNVWAD